MIDPATVKPGDRVVFTTERFGGREAVTIGSDLDPHAVHVVERVFDRASYLGGGGPGKLIRLVGDNIEYGHEWFDVAPEVVIEEDVMTLVSALQTDLRSHFDRLQTLLTDLETYAQSPGSSQWSAGARSAWATTAARLRELIEGA
jgi:hypothetical protein